MNIFKKIYASLRLCEAIRQADEAHKETGERYYVMPTSGKSGQLIIMDRYNFRKLKQKRYVSREASVLDLERECFYCTPYRNGKNELADCIIKMKRKMYYSWLVSLKKQKDNGKVRKY